MKIITPLDENQEVDYKNSYTIFLAGGCTTSWRDDFVRRLGELCKVENVVVFTPFCDSKKNQVGRPSTLGAKAFAGMQNLSFQF